MTGRPTIAATFVVALGAVFVITLGALGPGEPPAQAQSPPTTPNPVTYEYEDA